MTWEFDIHGGNEMPDHSVPGTKVYTVDGRVDDAKNPPTKLASVTNLEVKVNENGVFVDKAGLRRQVADQSLRARFITEIKLVLTEEGLTAPGRVPRTYRHQLRAEDGLRWQGEAAEDETFRVRAREQIEKLARDEGCTAGDTIVVWAEDVGELDSWLLP